MKPLLPAPYTPEDETILFRHGRGRWATTLRASGLQADIRDAELMLTLLHGAPDRGRRRRARAWQGWATAPQGYRVPPR